VKNLPGINEFVDGILKRDIALLSRAITLVESTKEEYLEIAQEILGKLMPYTGNSFRLGITGVPGVGKSTFIESFGIHVVNQKHKLAVLAVDPSSQISKGSILGDKTRMEHLSTHPNVYIRPSPSSGNLGGVAQKTKETILLCEAAGFDFIITETVGVGQSETTIHQLTDFFLLLMLAGAGDELQGIKRGIMEMADAILITKADGTNIENAKVARAQYASALHLFPPAESGWIPEVSTCSAITNDGIAEAYACIEKYHRHTKATHFFQKKRNRQQIFWFHKLIEDKLKADFYNNPAVLSKIKAYENDLLQNKATPQKLINALFDKLSD
jgi:LAO/AO transport system kinase